MGKKRHTDVELAVLADRAYDRKTGSVNELEYLIDKVHGRTAIAIRGTEFSKAYKGMNWFDIVRDVRIVPWYDSHVGWAHAGMLKGAQALYKELFQTGEVNPMLSRIRHEGKVYVTGHSLGGGVGYLLALMMHKRLYLSGVNVEYVGFGTPNVMVSQPVYTFPCRFYRNGDDVVTELLGHVVYKDFPHIRVGDPEGFEPIGDHTDMRGYIRAVEKHWG